MEEINLYKLLRFYVQNWLLIVSLTLMGLAAGLAYNEFIQVPMYKSNATLLFVNPSGVSSTQDSTRLSNYVQLFQSRRVLEPVMSEQKIGLTFDQFIGSVAATNDKGTEVIRLSVSTDDPAKSQDFLREAVVSFKAEAVELYGADSLRVVDNAGSAEPPYNVKKNLQLAIATGAGFVVSLIVLFFIYDASGGKAGKLGLKKNAKKPAKAKAPKKRAAKVSTTTASRSKSDESKVAVAAGDSKAKTFFAQLGEDLKQGLWIDQPTQPSTPVSKPKAAPKKRATAAKPAPKKRTAKKTQDTKND